MSEQGAVAGEPRLFVGQVTPDCTIHQGGGRQIKHQSPLSPHVDNVPQIPVSATAEDLLPLFAPFAARGLRALNIIKEPDGRSKGCAMVLFERWAEGERRPDL